LSLFIISLFGSYLNSYQQCTKDADDEIERSTKIARELFQRELRIQTIIMTKPSVAEIRQELQKPNAYYPELAGLSIDILRETYASLMNRVMGVNGVPLTKEQVSLLPLYSISRGIIPPEISDKDIPKMREYAEQMLARAWPLPLPGFGVSRLRPACGPSNLFDRLMHGTEAHIVQWSDTAPTPPKVLPLPNQRLSNRSSPFPRREAGPAGLPTRLAWMAGTTRPSTKASRARGSIANKLAKATVEAALFLAALAAIGCENLLLEDI
jgi:hypothetical protein